MCNPVSNVVFYYTQKYCTHNRVVLGDALVSFVERHLSEPDFVASVQRIPLSNIQEHLITSQTVSISCVITMRVLLFLKVLLNLQFSKMITYMFHGGPTVYQIS